MWSIHFSCAFLAKVVSAWSDSSTHSVLKSPGRLREMCPPLCHNLQTPSGQKVLRLSPSNEVMPQE